MNLDLYAERHGVMVVYDDIPASQAISVPGAVCLDYSFTAHEGERAVVLAHELGHQATGAFYTRDASQIVRAKAERRADVWAVRHLVTKKQLQKAMRRCSSDWELAQLLGLPEDEVRRICDYYLCA